jgi:2-keto-3-deoxy-L-fuconate dehydrogenase
VFTLEKKTVVVTGGGSGIGEAMVHCFIRAGANKIFLLDRDLASATRVAQAAGADRVQPLACDVAGEHAVDSAATTILSHAGRCDVLVNNAGIGHVGTILQTTADDLARLWSVNVAGVFHLCKRILPAMIDAGGGAIVNTASVGGVVALRDRLAYCTTKFAVVGLTKCLALDHAHQNVRVNCICPGRVETPFVQARIREYPDPEKAYAEMAASHPMNRMANPDEIAAAALYLASEEASFVTGSCLIVDGGLSVGK